MNVELVESPWTVRDVGAPNNQTQRHEIRVPTHLIEPGIQTKPNLAFLPFARAATLPSQPPGRPGCI